MKTGYASERERENVRLCVCERERKREREREREILSGCSKHVGPCNFQYWQFQHPKQLQSLTACVRTTNQNIAFG